MAGLVAVVEADGRLARAELQRMKGGRRVGIGEVLGIEGVAGIGGMAEVRGRVGNEAGCFGVWGAKRWARVYCCPRMGYGGWRRRRWTGQSGLSSGCCHERSVQW